jgi:hypothetical protein
MQPDIKTHGGHNMRLLKLAAYALFGYAIYEFIRGMVNEADAQRSGAAGSFGGGGNRKSRITEAGSTPNITGPGEGQEVRTKDSDGGMMSHRVGRGVVR